MVNCETCFQKMGGPWGSAASLEGLKVGSRDFVCERAALWLWNLGGQGSPKDLESAFNALWRLRVKSPGTKESSKEVEGTMQQSAEKGACDFPREEATMSGGAFLGL